MKQDKALLGYVLFLSLILVGCKGEKSSIDPIVEKPSSFNTLLSKGMYQARYLGYYGLYTGKYSIDANNLIKSDGCTNGWQSPLGDKCNASFRLTSTFNPPTDRFLNINGKIDRYFINYMKNTNLFNSEDTLISTTSYYSEDQYIGDTPAELIQIGFKAIDLSNKPIIDGIEYFGDMPQLVSSQFEIEYFPEGSTGYRLFGENDYTTYSPSYIDKLYSMNTVESIYELIETPTIRWTFYHRTPAINTNPYPQEFLTTSPSERLSISLDSLAGDTSGIAKSTFFNGVEEVPYKSVNWTLEKNYYGKEAIVFQEPIGGLKAVIQLDATTLIYQHNLADESFNGFYLNEIAFEKIESILSTVVWK